ncbi:acyl-CoA dehydrogenase family protein [Alteromonas portus]|uniref:acyl-CoA dehydrogenase family protein n=1 Tax=Alteromonas portus TaxID=2565549 RepID=UPI003BF8E68E
MSELNLINFEEKLKLFTSKWHDIAREGFFSLPVANEYGGKGYSFRQVADAMIKLGEQSSDGGLMLAAGAHMWAGIMPIQLFGSDHQKSFYLPSLASGEKVIAHGITEDLTGSDLKGIKTIAKKVEGGYLLSGRKTLITNAPVADYYLILAKAEKCDFRNKFEYSTFILNKDMQGITVSGSFPKMGLNTAQMGSIEMSDCFVPEENILGQEAQGQSIFFKTMEIERSMILAPAVGRMKALLKRALYRLNFRRKNNSDISHCQYIQEKIVELEINIETSRNILISTANKLDEGKLAMKHAAMTKLLISNNWEKSVSAVMSIFGGQSYLIETQLEEELRDAIGSRYYSGTDEIQKNTIYSLAGL